MMKKLRQLVRETRGDSLPEFGISAIVLLMVIFGIMDFSRGLYVYHFVSYAAEEGTRYAVVRGSQFSGTSCSTQAYACDATSTDIQTYVRGLAPPGVTASNITVTTTWSGKLPNGTAGSCSTTKSVDGCMVQVKVSVPFQFVLSFLPSSSMTFTSTSQAVTQQ